MKKHVIFILSVILIMTSCVKSINEVFLLETDVTVLKGRAVEGTNHTALPNIIVSVTNGSHTFISTSTNDDGYFELEVNYSIIDPSYYLLLNGGSSEIRKKERLKGVSVPEYNYFDIVMFTLPSFKYDNHTYQVAPDPQIRMYWNNANNYCNALTYCNYSDWRLPNNNELLQIYASRGSIGGFYDAEYWSSDKTDDYYTGYNYIHDYYYISFKTGQIYHMQDGLVGVRPIRVLSN